VNITPEAVGIILAVVFPLSALVLWAIKTTVAPLQVVIENNTAAMNHIMEIVDTHGVKLENHSVRLTKIETVHEIEADA